MAARHRQIQALAGSMNLPATERGFYCQLTANARRMYASAHILSMRPAVAASGRATAAINCWEGAGGFSEHSSTCSGLSKCSGVKIHL